MLVERLSRHACARDDVRDPRVAEAGRADGERHRGEQSLALGLRDLLRGKPVPTAWYLVRATSHRRTAGAVRAGIAATHGELRTAFEARPLMAKERKVV
jgi:hypothetical protein